MDRHDDIRIPHSIYFDTNSLWEAGDHIDQRWIVQLLGLAIPVNIRLCIPQLALDEWLHHLEQRGVEARDDMTSAARRLGRLLGREPPQIEMFDKRTLKCDVARTHKERVDRAGFVIIPVPELSLGNLLSEAVTKKSPFQKGDRGFRDAVILESIRADAKQANRQTPIMVVSKDSEFLAGTERITCDGIHVIKTGPADAENDLMTAFQQVGQADERAKKERARAFLNDHLNEIFAHATMQELPIDWTLTHKTPELKNTTVKGITAVRHTGISGVLPGFALTDDPRIKGRYPITFYVDMELDLVVEKINFTRAFLAGPRLRLDTREIVDNATAVEDMPMYVTEEMTVVHSVLLVATVVKPADDSLPFMDLQLL